MKSKLQFWKSERWKCSCGSQSFFVEVETKLRPTPETIFQGELVKQVRIICQKCGRQLQQEEVK